MASSSSFTGAESSFCHVEAADGGGGSCFGLSSNATVVALRALRENQSSFEVAAVGEFTIKQITLGTIGAVLLILPVINDGGVLLAALSKWGGASAAKLEIAGARGASYGAGAIFTFFLGKERRGTSRFEMSDEITFREDFDSQLIEYEDDGMVHVSKGRGLTTSESFYQKKRTVEGSCTKVFVEDLDYLQKEEGRDYLIQKMQRTLELQSGIMPLVTPLMGILMKQGEKKYAIPIYCKAQDEISGIVSEVKRSPEMLLFGFIHESAEPLLEYLARRPGQIKKVRQYLSDHREQLNQTRYVMPAVHIENFVWHEESAARKPSIVCSKDKVFQGMTGKLVHNDLRSLSNFEYWLMDETLKKCEHSFSRELYEEVNQEVLVKFLQSIEDPQQEINDYYCRSLDNLNELFTAICSVRQGRQSIDDYPHLNEDLSFEDECAFQKGKSKVKTSLNIGSGSCFLSLRQELVYHEFSSFIKDGTCELCLDKEVSSMVQLNERFPGAFAPILAVAVASLPTTMDQQCDVKWISLENRSSIEVDMIIRGLKAAGYEVLGMAMDEYFSDYQERLLAPGLDEEEFEEIQERTVELFRVIEEIPLAQRSLDIKFSNICEGRIIDWQTPVGTKLDLNFQNIQEPCSKSIPVRGNPEEEYIISLFHQIREALEPFRLGMGQMADDLLEKQIALEELLVGAKYFDPTLGSYQEIRTVVISDSGSGMGKEIRCNGDGGLQLMSEGQIESFEISRESQYEYLKSRLFAYLEVIRNQLGSDDEFYE